MSVHKIAHRIKGFEKIIQNLYRSFSGLLKIIILSKFNIRFPKPKAENCIILGNGPSLKETFAEYADVLRRMPVMCVNNFATSPEFQEFKPCYYVILDPGFFLNKQRPDVIATFNVLKNNTDWELDFFVPYLYRNDPDLKSLRQANAHVKVCFYNYTIVKGFDSLAFRLFSKNLAMPQFYNVLGASVFLAVNMGYKNIWLTGADHTWFDDIYVNEDNSLCRKDYHFYDKTEQPYIPIIDPVSGTTQKVGDFFNALHRVFDSYYLLNNYSRFRKSRIYNASEFSYIDAFERRKLNEL